MRSITVTEWQSLPEQAQQELLDFFYFLKQKYNQHQDAQETQAFSNHSAQQVSDWLLPEEDEVWK
ncbi:DUF2281 domain-containing protein [Thiomicrospira microaerophila]|uniref:DUF2281 domain-containing protein n=1 Tax=Thiomicrospira microaerophila TaxID=406020 RepID=UPI00200C126B|nr:DUF2281 domain-containing protein [Thiomicrospira microaerophila]UQB42509.1 DUF2281 domain-containing protein [Thiomicrospira microaerophila]